MWLSEILSDGASDMALQWGSTINLRWMCTVTSWYPSSHDFKCCQAVKPSPKAIKVGSWGTNKADIGSNEAHLFERNDQMGWPNELSVRLPFGDILGNLNPQVWFLFSAGRSSGSGALVCKGWDHPIDAWLIHLQFRLFSVPSTTGPPKVCAVLSVGKCI